MSRGRFRIKIDQPSEAAVSLEPRGQLQIFSTKDPSGWAQKTRKPRASHRRGPSGGPTDKTRDSILQKSKNESAAANSVPVKSHDPQEPESWRAGVEGSLALDLPDAIPSSISSPPRRETTSPRESILDVFLSEPQPLTFEEQSFVVKWLQFSSDLAWGSDSKSPFCPSRDIAWRSIVTYPSGLPWTLIDCDTFLAWSRRTAVPPRLHRRKAMAYQYISKLLADPRTQISDEAMHCVCSAITVESRSVSPEINRIHLMGLAQMIAQRGLQDLFSCVCFMFHPMFCLGFFSLAELETLNMADVHLSSDKFLAALGQLQQHVQGLQARSGVQSDQPRNREPGSPWSIVMGASMINPTVMSLLMASGRTQTLQQELGLFLNLYLVNLILWDFSVSRESAASFLDRLSVLADTSTPRLELMVWMVAQAWTDVDAASNRKGGGQAKEVSLTEAVIDATRVFSRVTIDSKVMLTSVMASWLSGGEAVEDKPAQGSKTMRESNPGSASTNTVRTSQMEDPSPGAAEEMDIPVSANSSERQKQRGIQYFTRLDLETVKDEARSDWYEQNISKKPMAPVPMKSAWSPHESPPLR